MPIIRFTSERRCVAHASKSIGQGPRIVKSCCYWMPCRLLELVAVRRRSELINEIELLVMRHEVVDHVEHYNSYRPHRSLDQRAPDSGRYRADPASLTSARFVGDLLGGLLDEYEIAARTTELHSRHPQDGCMTSRSTRHQGPDGVQLATASGNSCSPSDVLGMTPGEARGGRPDTTNA